MFRRKTYEELVLKYRYKYALLKKTLVDPGPDLEELFEIHFQRLVQKYLPEGIKEISISLSTKDSKDDFLFKGKIPKEYKAFAKAKGLRIVSKTYNTGYEYYEKVYYLSL